MFFFNEKSIKIFSCLFCYLFEEKMTRDLRFEIFIIHLPNWQIDVKFKRKERKGVRIFSVNVNSI